MAAHPKRREHKSDFFASADAKDKWFGSIYPGMIEGKAFQKLSNFERLMYVYCRAEYSSEKGRQALYAFTKAEGTEDNYSFGAGYFVFPSSHLERFGVDRANASRAMKKLAQAGFVEIIENNAHRRKMNVYRFSTKWRNG